MADVLAWARRLWAAFTADADTDRDQLDRLALACGWRVSDAVPCPSGDARVCVTYGRMFARVTVTYDRAGRAVASHRRPDRWAAAEYAPNRRARQEAAAWLTDDPLAVAP